MLLILSLKEGYEFSVVFVVRYSRGIQTLPIKLNTILFIVLDVLFDRGFGDQNSRAIWLSLKNKDFLIGRKLLLSRRRIGQRQHTDAAHQESYFLYRRDRHGQ